jgi:hypothetical protein
LEGVNMKDLRISDSLSLPLDWIQLATVVYGARGAGKTCFGRVAAEEAFGMGLRFCAIDLKGDWRGLKSSADGKSEGIPVVIFGGEHADVPLEPDAGAFVGETVAGLQQSVVLDFELFSKGKQIRFLAPFFEALYHHNREPLLLLLDEAQRYAPQKPGPDEARTLGAVQDLVKLGRKHGIGLVVFTQRGAGLSKEVAELCDMLVAFRTPGPLDQERIKDWLDANTTKAQRDDVMGRLAGLATGTAVFASGHPEVKTFGVYPVRRPTTFDSSATPKIGERRAEPKRLAKPDLESIRTKMSAAIERAKADDPKELRKTIAQLRAELAKKPAAAPIEIPKEIAVEVPVVDHATVRAIGNAVVAMRELEGQLAKVTLMTQQAADAARAAPQTVKARTEPIVTLRSTPPTMVRGPAGSPVPKPPQRPIVYRDTKPANGASTELGNSGARRMLTVLCQAGNEGVTASQLAIRSGIAKRGGTFRTYLGKIITNRWAARDGSGRIVRTSLGETVLGDFDPLPSGDALLAFWLAELGQSGAARILETLADAHPYGLTREEIGERTGIAVAGGTFRTYVGKLKTLELIGGRGELRLSEDLVG